MCASCQCYVNSNHELPEMSPDEDLMLAEAFHVKANTTIEDFNEYFGLELSDDEFDTIGGIVLQTFGHLPELGESIEVAGLKFEVLNADARRLRLLRVDTPQPIEHSELA